MKRELREVGCVKKWIAELDRILSGWMRMAATGQSAMSGFLKLSAEYEAEEADGKGKGV